MNSKLNIYIYICAMPKRYVSADSFNTVAVKRCSCPWHGRRSTRRRLLRSRTQKAGRSAPAILMAMGHGISYHRVLNPYVPSIYLSVLSIWSRVESSFIRVLFDCCVTLSYFRCCDTMAFFFWWFVFLETGMRRRYHLFVQRFSYAARDKENRWVAKQSSYRRNQACERCNASGITTWTRGDILTQNADG